MTRLGQQPDGLNVLPIYVAISQVVLKYFQTKLSACSSGMLRNLTLPPDCEGKLLYEGSQDSFFACFFFTPIVHKAMHAGVHPHMMDPL